MKKIVIIGAGIAGLAAARALQHASFDVVILEARDRSGGRIAVDHSWGVKHPLGAHWIHGGVGNPMLELANEFSTPISLYPTGYSHLYADEGKLVSQEDSEAFDHQFDEALKKAHAFAFNEEKDISLKDALAPFIPTSQDFLFYSALLGRRLTFFENYMGADYSELSARYWDMSHPYPDENYIVLDSFSSIIEGLSKDCMIQFDSVVKEIHWNEHTVKVVTEKNNFYADAVIVTLPLGVLKKNAVTFYPALPQRKQQAIDRIGMGLFDVAVLEFPLSFWVKNSPFMFIEDEKPTYKMFLNMQMWSNQPILYAYTGGKTASALEALSDDQIIDRLMTTLKSVFGQGIPYPTRYLISRWGKDLYSAGSYSYVAKGASQDDFIALAEPIENRLFFAGEATFAHVYDATTHSAYLSGVREAGRIKCL